MNEKVWVVITRGAFFGVYRTREAACDDYTRIAKHRYGEDIGWTHRGFDTWVAVGSSAIGVVTVEQHPVQD